jgi:23S rRNA pseudouridine1911/1915/1917 synthase
MEYAVDVYFKSRGIKEPARVIHRLDRGTSGVMFFPKSGRPATHISYMLKTGGVEKVYWALVAGFPEEDQWEVDVPIAKLSKFRYGTAIPGKPAKTLFRVLGRSAGVTLVEARPLTGRTHQIRVHLVHAGFPIIGDATYGGDQAARMMLHCRSMAFRTHDGREVRAKAPVDGEFERICGSYGIEIGTFQGSE